MPQLKSLLGEDSLGLLQGSFAKSQKSENQARKRHINVNFFGPVALGTTPGLSQGQTHFVPGTSPSFLLALHNGSQVYPRDKPSLALGQCRGQRAAQKAYVLKVYVPFVLVCQLSFERYGNGPRSSRAKSKQTGKTHRKRV